MKKNIAIAVLSLACLAGCSGKPPEVMAKEHLKISLRSEMGEGANMTAFKKTGFREGTIFGLKYRDVDYSYELLCKLPVPIKGLRRLPIENVILLDEFFKVQTEPWEKLDFTPVRRVRLDGPVREASAEAYAQKKSLFFCKPGEKRQMTGTTRLIMKNNGWTIE
jgi:hypothetical protein